MPKLQPGQTAPRHARVCIQHVQPGQRSTQGPARPWYLAKPTRKSFPAISEGSFASGELVCSSELLLACLNSATPTAPQECFNRDHWVKLCKSERAQKKHSEVVFPPLRADLHKYRGITRAFCCSSSQLLQGTHETISSHQEQWKLSGKYLCSCPEGKWLNTDFSMDLHGLLSPVNTCWVNNLLSS